MIKKFIRGNHKRGAEVIAELEKLGGINNIGLNGTESGFFYIDSSNIIRRVEAITTTADIISHCFEEIFLPKEPKFDPSTLKPFDKVLVRNNEHNKDEEPDTWACDFYSHKGFLGTYITLGHVIWDECIPYNEKTAHLVGTYERPPEYYDIFD